MDLSFLDTIFVELTTSLMVGFGFGDHHVGNTFFLADGSVGRVMPECSGAGLFLVLLFFALIRFRRRRANCIMLLITPVVAVLFNAIRCMMVIGHGMLMHDVGGFAIFAVPVLTYAMLDYGIIDRKWTGRTAMLALAAFGLWRATPAYANDNKTPSNVVDVVGITLHEVVASSKDVKLAWTSSNGTNMNEIHVFYRDKERDGLWVELATISGATNATINGFFIDRNTEWKVDTLGVGNE